MVGKDYMLDKQAPPSLSRRLVNQKLIPVLIDAAGLLEGRIVLLSGRVARAPLASILMMFGLGGSAGYLAVRTLRGTG